MTRKSYTEISATLLLLTVLSYRIFFFGTSYWFPWVKKLFRCSRFGTATTWKAGQVGEREKDHIVPFEKTNRGILYFCRSWAINELGFCLANARAERSWIKMAAAGFLGPGAVYFCNKKTIRAADWQHQYLFYRWILKSKYKQPARLKRLSVSFRFCFCLLGEC